MVGSVHWSRHCWMMPLVPHCSLLHCPSGCLIRFLPHTPGCGLLPTTWLNALAHILLVLLARISELLAQSELMNADAVPWSWRLRPSLLLQPRKGCFEVRRGDRTFASLLVHPYTCTHHRPQMVLHPYHHRSLHQLAIASCLYPLNHLLLPSDGAWPFVQPLDGASWSGLLSPCLPLPCRTCRGPSRS